MSVSNTLRLARTLDIPRSKLDVFMALARKRPVKSIVDLGRILAVMKINQATTNLILNKYIATQIQAPSISSGSSMGNLGKNVVDKNGSVSSKQPKATVVIPTKSSSAAPMKRSLSNMKNAPSTKRQRSNQPKKRGRPKSLVPRIKSLKQVLEGVDISRNEFLGMVNTHYPNASSKVRKTLEGVPSYLDQAILPHAMLDAFHHQKSKRMQINSTNSLVNATIKSKRTAKLLAEALGITIPETMTPVHRQKLHNATSRVLQGLPPTNVNASVDQEAKDELKRLLALEIKEEDQRLQMIRQAAKVSDPFAKMNLQAGLALEQINADKFATIDRLMRLQKKVGPDLRKRIDRAINRVVEADHRRSVRAIKNGKKNNGWENKIKLAGDLEQMGRKGGPERPGIESKVSENISRQNHRRAKSDPQRGVDPQFSYTRIFNKPPGSKATLYAGSLSRNWGYMPNPETRSLMTNASGGRGSTKKTTSKGSWTNTNSTANSSERTKTTNTRRTRSSNTAKVGPIKRRIVPQKIE